MDQLGRTIDNLQDVITQLEDVRVNLTKLPLERRTQETLSRQYERARNLWSSINKYYDCMKALDAEAAAEFRPKYETGQTIFSKIEEFLKKNAAIPSKHVLPEVTIHQDSSSDSEAPKAAIGRPKDLKRINAPESPYPVPSHESQPTEHEQQQQVPPQIFKFVPGVGYVLKNPTAEMFNRGQIEQDNKNTTEALLHAIAKLTLERENASRPTDPWGEGRGIKLPEIQIKEYNGDITKYREFKEQFDSLVERSKMSNIHRFTLLKSKLTGKALESISDLVLTGDNYLVALSTLERTFDNPKHLIKLELEAMLALPHRTTISGNAESILAYMHYTKGRVSNLKRNKITGEQIMAYLILRGFDPITRGRMDDFANCKTRFPTLEEIEDFLFKEYQHNLDQNDNLKFTQTPFSLSKKDSNVSQTRVHATLQPNKANTNITKVAGEHSTTEPPKKCFICTEQHPIIDCPKFLSSPNREAFLREHKICIYCVKHRFDYRSPCRSRQYLNCKTCQGSHLTEMHPQSIPIMSNPSQSSNTYLCKNESDASSGVLLPTAIATLLVNNDNVPVRCLLDQGSQANYITEDLVQKLRLPKKRTLVKILGVGGEIGTVRFIANIKLKLDHPDLPILNIKALVVKRVTGSLPSMSSHIAWKSSFDKPLADPHFNKPAHIPLLLGGPVYSTVLRQGLEKKDGLLLQNTYLGGWIVSGDPGNGNMAKRISTLTTLSELETNLLNFWDLPVTGEDTGEVESSYCENLFIKKQSRTEDGRYIVPIPWKVDAPALGNSYRSAMKFYIGQERRWEQNEIHKKMSNDFMEDYLASNHMSPIPIEKQRDETGNAFYIPYISIIRKDALTTKLRNVFNASAPSSNGISLNQLIHPGPKLQCHIFDIIHQNRQYKFAYTSDMQQMFRQFLIPQADRDKFRILWRPNKTQPLGEFWLNTVTYGVDCAPWQAIRTIHQIADDNAPDLKTKDIIINSIYMDDLFHGADSIKECQEQIPKIISTLEAGKLTLTKWSANNPAILHNIEDNKKIDSYKETVDPTIKILGINYNPVEDAFLIRIPSQEQVTYTKRGLLSMAASIYDPMGWVLPVIMLLRIRIQELWILKYDWDEQIDEKIQQKFKKIYENLPQLRSIRIPRWIQGTQDTPIQLIGFCDASGDGYAAVLYSRVKNENTFATRLLAAKGRVTPLKTRANKDNKLCTIPKMELEGIVLLTELLNEVRSKLHHPNITVFLYTDSEVALSWVRNSNTTNNKFVSKRVTKIRKIISPGDIHYVKSEDNPADPASRGLTPEKLINNRIWFDGPAWLLHDQLPRTPLKNMQITMTHVTQNLVDEENFIERFSCFKRLLRVTAYCLRWARKKPIRESGPISAEEITNAKTKIILFQQHLSFKNEIEHFKKSKTLPKKSWMISLTPMFGPGDNILRVGGRISLANLPESHKHPILLTKCHLVDLIVRQTHLDHHHCGNSQTEHLIREEFWIPAIKSRVKKCIRSCPLCIRWKAQTVQPIMGDLPAERITPGPPFSKIGVDLCGPFSIKASAIRFDRIIKVWVAVFVCLVTKAVHLEICSDLSTDMFLAAFTRFANRRCWPSLVLSDNGTNFVGAKRKINQEWVKATKNCKERLAIQEIVWKFNPPYSPNFGGLWEAAVKSMKHLMRKMANITNLTYEEFNSLLCRIEGILNSRPLHPESTEVEDAPALTPFHFITQRSFRNSAIDASLSTAVPITKRWLQVKQLQQQFWERFHQEYLHQLQKRNKWRFPARTLNIGDLVLLQEPSTTPADWKMGRIIECYPDTKGDVRRVDVKTTKRDVVHRATNRLVPLFPEDAAHEPIVRRSNREHVRTTSLLTRVLLCWMALTTPTTKALKIQTLTTGIHTHRLGDAFIKYSDLEFSVETSLNFTADMISIENHVTEFYNHCLQYQNSTYLKLYQHCRSLEETLRREAITIKEGIVASYFSERTKRSIGSLALKGVIKYGPQILLTAGIAYQAVENNQLEHKIEQMDTKIKRILEASRLMADISNLEHKSVDGKLHALFGEQQQLRLQDQMNDYSASIQILISAIQANHQNIISIRPVEALQTYVTKLNNGLNFCRLPTISNAASLFTLNTIKTTIRNNMVIVTFNIPLVQTRIFSKIAFISVPSAEDHAILFDRGEFVQEIVLCNDNNTSFDPIQAIDLGYGIYDSVKEIPLSACWREMLRNPSSLLLFNICTPTPVKKQIDKIYRLQSDLAVIYQTIANKVSIVCNATQSSLVGKVNIVRFPGCRISSSQFDVMSPNKDIQKIKTDIKNLSLEDSMSLPEIGHIGEPTDDPRLAILKAELEAELDADDWDLWEHQHWYLGAICILICIAVFSITYLCKCRPRQRSEIATISYLNKEDMIPGSWLQDYMIHRDTTPHINTTAV